MIDHSQAAVWLDIPRSCQLRARFNADLDIQVMVGQPNGEMNMVFERSALMRFVEIVCELLAVPVPTTQRSSCPPSGGQHGTQA